MTTSQDPETNIHHVVAIIDRSGSMAGKEEDTIGGINSTFEELKTNPAPDINVKVSIKLFDHEEKMLIKEVNLNDVKPVTKEQYFPRGQTALYDAMGNTLNYFMEKKIKDANIYKSCSIFVVTDGLENISKNYNSNNLKLMIENAEKYYNIKLFYLGANQDAILEASKIGITNDQALNYCELSGNVDAAYRSAASASKRHASGTPVAFTGPERMASQSSDFVYMAQPSNMHQSSPLPSPPKVQRQRTKL
tara:strand:- start:126 stop:872 length:747 start_codon:yes stop_codon:yes gene_type:complete